MFKYLLWNRGFNGRTTSKDPKFYDSPNEMVARKLKTVYRGIPINIFVGLKPKMNSMLSDDGKESNTENE